MPVVECGEIVFNQPLTKGYLHLRAYAPEVARDIQPGQFVQVKVRPGMQPLLRTPLSIHDASAEHGWLDLLYRILGESTQLLSEMKSGDSLDLLGPLGHGFSLPEAGYEAWLLAGGIGVAPLYYLATQLLLQGYTTRLLYGVRTASELVRAEDFQKLGVQVYTSSDDGSTGFRGTVVQLAESIDLPKHVKLYACGPRPMLRAVDELAVRRGLPAELSLEEYMACGIGACLGCACAMREGGYAHVCTDGPVFRGGEVRL